MASYPTSSSFFLTVLVVIPLTFATTEWTNYTQRLNHFGYGGLYEGEIFQQRLVIDNTYWTGAANKGPFLVVFGGEAPIKTMVNAIGVASIAAPRLGALVLYIEHRFYGTSIPYGTIDAALFAPEVRNFLTSEQALADFARIILSLKANLSASASPVIVLGPSYAGMLAAWFRLKYPYIAVGALASSAPVLYSEYIPSENDFCSIVSRDFELINRRCADIIRQSWSMIDNIASRLGGLGLWTKTFNLCSPLNSTYELKLVLVRMYGFAAQYNGRYNHWINSVCDPIVKGDSNDVVEAVARAFLTINPNVPCIDIVQPSGAAAPYDVLDANSLKAWQWQQCSEIVVVQGCKGPNSMLPREFFKDQAQLMQDCQLQYLASPQPDWIPTYYGGRAGIEAGSNIIFSNGLMDPFSSAGILEDISDTIVAIKTKQGSHCLDTNPAQPDDPKWLVRQREKEIHIFKKWINDGSSKSTFSVHLAVLLFLVHLV